MSKNTKTNRKATKTFSEDVWVLRSLQEFNSSTFGGFTITNTFSHEEKARSSFWFELFEIGFALNHFFLIWFQPSKRIFFHFSGTLVCFEVTKFFLLFSLPERVSTHKEVLSLSKFLNYKNNLRTISTNSRGNNRQRKGSQLLISKSYEEQHTSYSENELTLHHSFSFETPSNKRRHPFQSAPINHWSNKHLPLHYIQ